MKFGHYALQMYQRCPRQYRFRYIDRLPALGTPLLVMARHVHRALADLFELDPSNRSEDVLIRRLRNAWVNDRGVFGGDRELEREWGQRAIAMLQQFARHYDIRVRPLLVEHRVEGMIDGSIVLWGRVDRVDPLNSDLAKVIDYKAGKLPADIDLWLERDLSAATYAIAVRQRLKGRSINKVEFIYLENPKSVCVPITDDFLRGKIDDIKLIVDRLRADRSWNPIPGSYCNWCDYRDRCPEGQAYVTSHARVAASESVEDLPF